MSYNFAYYQLSRFGSSPIRSSIGTLQLATTSARNSRTCESDNPCFPILMKRQTKCTLPGIYPWLESIRSMLAAYAMLMSLANCTFLPPEAGTVGKYIGRREYAHLPFWEAHKFSKYISFNRISTCLLFPLRQQSTAFRMK